MFHLFLLIFGYVKNLSKQISFFFLNISIDILNWIEEIPFVQWLLNTAFIQWLYEYKFIFWGILGGIIENSVMLISSGFLCHKSYFKLFLSITISGICSFIFDISFFFIMLKFTSKFNVDTFNKKYPKLSKFLNKMGVYSMIVYRLIPFARIPAMLISLKCDRRKVVIYNLIGAFAANALFIIIGFFL